jgi:hypothetical protein
LVEIKDFLIAPGLCHFHGMMEYWNIGIRAEINHFNCKKLLQTHHSITPPFHYSNWGEAPKFILHHINFFSRTTIWLIIPE